jgi:hypothetical protein
MVQQHGTNEPAPNNFHVPYFGSDILSGEVADTGESPIHYNIRSPMLRFWGLASFPRNTSVSRAEGFSRIRLISVEKVFRVSAAPEIFYPIVQLVSINVVYLWREIPMVVHEYKPVEVVKMVSDLCSKVAVGADIANFAIRSAATLKPSLWEILKSFSEFLLRYDGFFIRVCLHNVLPLLRVKLAPHPFARRRRRLAQCIRYRGCGTIGGPIESTRFPLLFSGMGASQRRYRRK